MQDRRLPKLRTSQQGPSADGMGGRHGVPEQRRTDVTKLQKAGKHCDCRQYLQVGLALSHRNHNEGYGSNESDRQQNEKPEPDSQNRSDQRAANGQRGHATYSMESEHIS